MDNEKDLELEQDSDASNEDAVNTPEDTQTETAQDMNAAAEEIPETSVEQTEVSKPMFSAVPEEKPEKNNGGLAVKIVVGIIVVAIVAVAAYFIIDNVRLNSKYKALLDSNGNLMMTQLVTAEDGSEKFETKTLTDLSADMGISTEKFLKKFGNPYNAQGYVNTSGKTLKEVVDGFNEGDQDEEDKLTVADFLEEYQLPSDMPEDTIEAAAFYTMPVSAYAGMYGMDINALKTVFTSFPAAATEDTPWGVVEGELTLDDYVGAEYLDDFKAEYGLGDEVTIETKYKDIRSKIDTLLLQKRESAQQATEVPEATEAAQGGTEATQAPEATQVPEATAVPAQ